MQKNAGVATRVDTDQGIGDVDVLRSNQRNSPQFKDLLGKIQDAGVRVKACKMSLENIGLTEDQRFETEVVMGDVEIAECIKAGFSVLTF